MADFDEKDNSEQSIAQRTAQRTADAAGIADDPTPLGDPNAPQGTGREQDMSRPENRPAPAGKIRMSDAEEGSK